ncbi:MAG TPA: hypothetical protein VF450_26390 [Noviherbaspirillum sp.]
MSDIPFPSEVVIDGVTVRAGTKVIMPNKGRHPNEVANVTGVASDALFTDKGVALVEDLTKQSFNIP